MAEEMEPDPMDEALEKALEQKRKEAEFWSHEFQEATAKNDLARVLALSITQVKVLADAANTLVQVSMRASNQLQHLRIRAHKLEKFTAWLIALTIVLGIITLPLSIESTKHLIKPDKVTDTREREVFEGYERCVGQLDESAAKNGYSAEWAKARRDCAQFWFGNGVATSTPQTPTH